DGAVAAMKAQTGEPVWTYPITKRGINNCAVINGDTVIASHSEENLDTNEMGLIAAIDATGKGTLGKDKIKWSVTGIRGGYSSPIIDGDRVYQIDDSANLFAFDVNTGKELWKHTIGTLQRASPVLADGKLYVGTENGKFFILKPGPTGAEILDEDQLGTEEQPESIIASVAVANGRIYVISDSTIYCIGKKAASPATGGPPVEGLPNPNRPVTSVQVVPTELLLLPGDKVKFRARLFDEQGRLIREEPSASWSLDQLDGAMDNGQLTVTSESKAQAGLVKAKVGDITGSASVRVFPLLPWNEGFDSYAVNTTPPTWVNSTL